MRTRSRPRRFTRPIAVAALCAAAATPIAAQAPLVLDSAFLAGYRWRNIGPDRGGRSIAVSGVRGRPGEAYFGATGGGLWKTTDTGETWVPVTDFLIGSDPLQPQLIQAAGIESPGLTSCLAIGRLVSVYVEEILGRS